MKIALALSVLTLSGCANMNGWQHGGALLDRGPIIYQMPQAQSNGVADIGTHTVTYQLPGGTFQANRVGRTVTVIQTGR